MAGSAVAVVLAVAALEEVEAVGSPREVVGVFLSAVGVVMAEGAGSVDRREGDLQEVVVGSKAGSREEEEGTLVQEEEEVVVVGSHRWMVAVVDRADLLEVEADTVHPVEDGVVS